MRSFWYWGAGLPIAFGTADLALRERAHIKAGQVVLVLGAAGGVGVAAVQVHFSAPCQLVLCPNPEFPPFSVFKPAGAIANGPFLVAPVSTDRVFTLLQDRFSWLPAVCVRACVSSSH